MTLSYTVVVNSSDGFADCWPAFFTLFHRYWPACPARIILNTETVRWNEGEPRVETSRVQQGERRLSWTECLDACLAQVDTPLVLYLQEDYFLEANVATAAVDEFAEMMIADPGIAHIGLTAFGSGPPFRPSPDARLWEITKQSRYRISTQAGLWRADVLRSYLRPEENGWMFEIFGTIRSRRRSERFLTLNRDMYGSAAERIFPYSHTGVVKGRWHPDVQALFATEGIQMDFSRRGFYFRRPAILRKLETFRKLVRRPSVLIAGLRGN